MALLLLVMQLISGSAVADIAAFNDAVRRGDYVAAADHTEVVWRQLQAEGTATPLFAREFAFVNYLAGNYADAERFTGILEQRLAGADGTDDQPHVSRVLTRMVSLRLNPDTNERRLLRAALNSRLHPPGTDAISLQGASLLQAMDWAAGDWQAVQESTSVVIDLTKRGSARLLPHRRSAQLMAVAAGFIQRPHHRPYGFRPCRPSAEWSAQ